MLSKILSLSFFISLPSFSASSVSCADIFASQSSMELFLKKILETPTAETASTLKSTASKSFQFHRLRDFKIPNVHISHAVYFSEGQLMLIEIDKEGKRPIQHIKGSHFKDHEVAVVDLRSGHIVSLSSQFKNMDDIDIPTFESSGLIQPRLSAKNQLLPQLLVEPKKKMSQHADLKNMLPYQAPLVGALNIQQFRMGRSAFPLRDRLFVHDTFLMIPEKNPADLTQLQTIDPTVKSTNSDHVALGIFDHSSPHNLYRTVPQHKLEKSQNLFLYPREEEIKNYTLNSRFFAGMVNEGQLKIRIWSTRNGKIIKDLPTDIFQYFDTDQALSLYSSAQGRWLVVFSNQTLLIFDGHTLELQEARQTPSHFINQVIFSDSENAIAFQDKYHVFLWHKETPDQFTTNPPTNFKVDVLSTQGISQWISLPSDQVILLKPILPQDSDFHSNQEMTREKLEEQFGLRPSSHRWRAFKAKERNQLNTMMEVAPSKDSHFTLNMLPTDLPTTAFSAGNHSFISYTNQSDGTAEFVLVKVWRKTIEP